MVVLLENCTGNSFLVSELAEAPILYTIQI